jgi:hypothetical protein
VGVLVVVGGAAAVDVVAAGGGGGAAAAAAATVAAAVVVAVVEPDPAGRVLCRTSPLWTSSDASRIPPPPNAEALKLLPLYALSTLKGPGLRDGVRLDDRSMWAAAMMSLPAARASPLLYARLLALRPMLDGVEEADEISDGMVLSSEGLEQVRMGHGGSAEPEEGSDQRRHGRDRRRHGREAWQESGEASHDVRDR